MNVTRLGSVTHIMRGCSVSKSYAVGAHLACCRVDAIVALFAVFDALITSEATIALAHGPSYLDERLAGVDGNAGFKAQNAARR